MGAEVGVARTGIEVGGMAVGVADGVVGVSTAVGCALGSAAVPVRVAAAVRLIGAVVLKADRKAATWLCRPATWLLDAAVSWPPLEPHPPQAANSATKAAT